VTCVAEKCRRLPTNDHLFIQATGAVKKSRFVNKSESWQHNSDRILNEQGMIPDRLTKNRTNINVTKKYRKDNYIADLRNREELLLYPSTFPWQCSNGKKVLFNISVNDPCSKSDSNEAKFKASMSSLEQLGIFDYEIWTDGSVKDKKGAGAGLLFSKDRNTPFAKASAPSGFLSSSFRSEGVAIDIALKKLIDTRSLSDLNGKSLLICSDSQSSISALTMGPLRQGSRLFSRIWKSLLYLVSDFGLSSIVFQFVYSHCGIIRNEMVDKEANDALDLNMDNQHEGTIPLAAVKAAIKSGVRNLWKKNLDVNSCRFTCAGDKYSDIRTSSQYSRADEVLLSQLRSGECRFMGKFRIRLGIGDPLCRWCKEVNESIYHVYSECISSVILGIKKEINVMDISVLFSDPQRGLLFFNKALSSLHNIR
jgi:ribonuclease HI